MTDVITGKNRLVEHALCGLQLRSAIEEFSHASRHRSIRIHTYYTHIHTHSGIGNIASNLAKWKSRCDKRNDADLSAKHVLWNNAYSVWVCIIRLMRIRHINFFKHTHTEKCISNTRSDILCVQLDCDFYFTSSHMTHMSIRVTRRRGGSISCDSLRDSRKNNAKAPTWHTANVSSVLNRVEICINK